MAHKIAVEVLLKERQKLIEVKFLLIQQHDFKIQEIETAVDELCGKQVWTNEPPIIYDDESPDYIKWSIED